MRSWTGKLVLSLLVGSLVLLGCGKQEAPKSKAQKPQAEKPKAATPAAKPAPEAKGTKTVIIGFRSTAWTSG